jgi:flagellar basal body-associated protein FliL
MDNQNQNFGQPVQPEKNSVGALVGSIIVIIILILGAIYFWGGKLNQKANETPANVESSVVSDLETELGNVPEIDVDLNSL